MTYTVRAEVSRTVIAQDGVDRFAFNDDGSLELLTPVASPTGNQVPTASQIAALSSGSSAEITLTGATTDIPIPAGVKQITCGVYRLSLSGGGDPILRLGTSGGIISTGYLGGGSSSSGSTSSTTHFFVARAGAAADLYSGNIVLTRIGATNKWAISAQMNASDGTVRASTSSVDLGAELTTLRFMSTGASTFDSGSVAINYLR